MEKKNEFTPSGTMENGDNGQPKDIGESIQYTSLTVWAFASVPSLTKHLKVERLWEVSENLNFRLRKLAILRRSRIRSRVIRLELDGKNVAVRSIPSDS
ncbi:hypothetical protein CJ030_MR3G009475 [Morella rubra]|uniref:Uncharacterized protein n=1 Tax=Morella rubra TaxID=262757 RepID=A0A6A1W4J1_9ROSI|nr:hypothetical protein CJ030_MR3G009475 [Morella rubra]